MATTASDIGEHPPLFSPEFQRNPYPTYRHHLAGPPLQPLPGRPGIFMLWGYEACTSLIRDPRLSAVRPPAMLVATSAEELVEFDDLVRHMQRWLLMMDAPRHAELRKLMNRGFTPTVVEQLRPKVEAVIEGLIDDLEARHAVDLIKDFAYPLPVRVISDLLGVPIELHERCVVLSNDIAMWLGDFRRGTELARAAQAAVCELSGYFAQIIKERGRSRTGDLLSLLLDAAAQSGAMSEEDLHAQCVMLLFAGHETTRNLIGNGMFTLLKEPGALAELCADQALLPAAVEELLRFESPVQAFGRFLKEDAEVHGTRLPTGTGIMFMIGAANRDPRQFSEPDRLDLRRAHNRHLSFGGDAHVCLGSTLARLEGRLAIGALARRFPNLRLEREEPDWGENFGLRGLRSLRVAKLSPSAHAG